MACTTPWIIDRFKSEFCRRLENFRYDGHHIQRGYKIVVFYTPFDRSVITLAPSVASLPFLRLINSYFPSKPPCFFISLCSVPLKSSAIFMKEVLTSGFRVMY